MPDTESQLPRQCRGCSYAFVASWAQTSEVISTYRLPRLRSTADWPGPPTASPHRVESFRPPPSVLRFPCCDGAPEECAGSAPSPTRHWVEWYRRMTAWECHPHRS